LSLRNQSRGLIQGCSGAERRDKVLDEVSTEIHGGAAAVKIVKWPSSNTSHASMI